MADSTYHFLSYVRSGFSAALTQPDTFGAAQPALATAPVGVTVSGVAQPVTHQAVVRGPGDVIGLSASQVVRTDPIDGAIGVEPNYFAQIEFDRPDLPWLFTPAAPAGGRLRPWIVLVVLDAEGATACSVQPGNPLPVLHVSAAAASGLPDLADSFLWAHAQAILPDGVGLADAFKDGADPRLTISRLMCPRHLSPNRWYVAAVVPAFNVGRLAGLGLPVTAADEQRLDPAWSAGAAVDLPVYHSWRFRTGEDADFESLARQLKARPLPAGVGTRPMDVSRPGAGLPSLPAPDSTADARSITWLDGALRPIDSDKLPSRDPAAASAFQASLTVLLDRPADLVLAGNADPIVAPPIYGDKHALAVRLDGATVPPWISELNLDPRARVAAGLGTQVIQARQEDYVARAWRQLGDVMEANRLLRAAQLARSGSLRVHKRMDALDPAALLTLAYPSRQRVTGALAGTATLARSIATSRLPDAAVQPAFRRVARASAAAGRAAATRTLAPAVIERFAAQAFTVAVDGPDGSTNMRPAAEVIGAARSTTVLAAVGDAQPADAGRLDTMIATLAANRQALPTGDALRALTPRTDAGAVAVMGSLGALPARTIATVLTTAASPPPPPPAPPAAAPPPGVPPIRIPPRVITTQPLVRPPVAAPAVAITPAAALRLSTGAALAFQPVGPSKSIDTTAVLAGGAVVSSSDTVRNIALSSLTVQRVDDTRWSTLQQTGAIPSINRAADPVSDSGARLDAIRRDPASLSALAQVANGDLGAAQKLDALNANLVTTGASHTALSQLVTGHYADALPVVQPQVTGVADLSAARELLFASAVATDRMVRIDDSPALPLAPAFDLASAKTGLMARLDPAVTVAARVKVRLDIRVIAGVPKRDELDPVMACPQFNDPMWQAVRDLGAGWLLPGLDKIPPDTATLVRTNPGFVAAHLVGLNHEMMRELLWREYPTDQRGTPFHRFWGRRGAQPDDIGPVHQFANHLADNLLAGKTDEAVLLIRSELLRRYPGSIIYLCRAPIGADGEPELDDDSLVLPSFRGDLPPDISFVGFPVAPDDLRATADPWWFVIAQPPSEPRFGLDDWSDDTPAKPTDSGSLAWSHMSADGHPDSPAPFAIAHAPVLLGLKIDGTLTWGDKAADQAHLTYQHPVRVAIRAADLMPPVTPPGGSA